MDNREAIEKLTITEIVEHCSRTCENTERLAIAQGKTQDDITSKNYWEHYQVANYLKELQQYRELGTMEELKQRKTRREWYHLGYADCEKKYKELGKYEQVREAVERSKAKKT